MKKPTTTKKEVTAQEHFRLRAVTEKPSLQDCDKGERFIVHTPNSGWMMCCLTNAGMFDLADCWLPGHLPQHLIPKPESAEDRIRRTFEEWADPYFNLERDGTEYTSSGAQQSWLAWQAASIQKGVQA